MTEISLITWNIWFDQLERSRRTQEILNECIQINPDFILFQEAIPETVELIERYRKEYILIGNPLTQSYDTLILSKYPCLNWYRYALPNTTMGRNLLIGEFSKDGIRFQIGTFHLESVFPKAKLKLDQLNYISAITQENAILLGDTNLINETDSTNEIPLYDIFESIDRPLAFQYTYSGKTNSNIKNRKYNSRLDRIYTKIPPTVKRFELIGTKPTVYSNKLNQYIHPSDHYGLHTILRLKNSS